MHLGGVRPPYPTSPKHAGPAYSSQPYSPTKPRQTPKHSAARTSKIRVSGFWPKITKNMLLQFFQSFGQVLECRLIQDRRSGDANHAIVAFKDNGIVDHLLSVPRAINGTKLHLERTHAAPQPQQQLANNRPWENANANMGMNPLQLNTGAPGFARGPSGPPVPPAAPPSPSSNDGGLEGDALSLFNAIKSRGGEALQSDLPDYLIGCVCVCVCGWVGEC